MAAARAAAATARHRDWPGCFNARDLSGLPAASGMVTRRGAAFLCARLLEPAAG